MARQLPATTGPAKSSAAVIRFGVNIQTELCSFPKTMQYNHPLGERVL